ncbi:MAG: membrane protein of unknown function [Candidatus Doudnabacteria bacterium Gr01-1014_77]|uniref:TrbC/VIRB2 family protein n=1 Tax=Candidatus Doudnabacteria bacterium Gr01-1014_77 TaxID=2017133 RepID=A0A554JBL9_9BACT|nr:MAG: membrane protein of unknown function [Candidatus Doudnabacteria bacterium Gr01-1014_77]
MKKNKLVKLLASIGLAYAILVIPVFTFAADPPPAQNNGGGSCNIDGFNTTDTKLCNPLPDKDLGGLVYRLINYILIGISSMAIVTIVIAAFTIVSSQGNEEAVKGARTSISWAVVGIVLALLAYSIASIIESAVTR